MRKCITLCKHRADKDTFDNSNIADDNSPQGVWELTKLKKTYLVEITPDSTITPHYNLYKEALDSTCNMTNCSYSIILSQSKLCTNKTR